MDAENDEYLNAYLSYERAFNTSNKILKQIRGLEFIIDYTKQPKETERLTSQINVFLNSLKSQIDPAAVVYYEALAAFEQQKSMMTPAYNEAFENLQNSGKTLYDLWKLPNEAKQDLKNNPKQKDFIKEKALQVQLKNVRDVFNTNLEKWEQVKNTELKTPLID